MEWQLREIMHQAGQSLVTGFIYCILGQFHHTGTSVIESLKSDNDKQREEELLQELVTLVQERSHLVDRMDEERLRYACCPSR